MNDRPSRRWIRSGARACSALAVVLGGLALATSAASQQKPPAKPAPKSSTSAKSTDVTNAALPPPVWTGIPPGAYSVINQKPGLPIVIAAKPWPATLLGAAPSAAASATPANAALPTGPGDEQAIALSQLEAAAKEYGVGAKDYAHAVGQIIRQRYEQKRKARLSQIQENIDKDTAELKKARADTMERLKAFLQKYPDVPEHTPNAMFRLAALYEEEAIDADIDPSDPDYTNKLRAAYGPAENLYREIITRFPNYTQRPSVHFFLGALLSDTGRGPESIYVWRTLVCANHYEYPEPPATTPAEAKDREKWKDGIPPMKQDHLQDYWDKWQETHYLPPDENKTKKKPAPAKPGKTTAAVEDKNEDTYAEVYPDDCVPLGGAKTATGDEPRFVSQAWWRIGEYHYNRGDDSAQEEGYFGASPYRLNRALSAYTHAIATENETVKVFSMYKIAWTLYKQQRYTAARNKFIELLDYFDAKEAKGGEAGDAQMRQDAWDYSAASLTYLQEEKDDPKPDEPFIERDDVFGKYSGKELEDKLSIAITKVQDPKYVPQDKPWTPKIYKSLAAEFESDEVQMDAIKTYEIIIKKWPCDPEDPQFRKNIADLYDLLAVKAESQAEKDAYSAKALDSRSRLIDYVGKTPWTECNKNNPDAIHAAEALMGEGVKNAAGHATALGRVYLSKAKQDPEGSPQLTADLESAYQSYSDADNIWTKYLAQDPEASDAYETQYWIADAKHKKVLCLRLLDKPIRPEEVEDARAAAVKVRDSNLDDKYLRYAAYFAVDVVDQLAQQGFDAYKKAGCQIGTDNVRREDRIPDGDQMKTVTSSVPVDRIEVIESPLDEPGDACRPDQETESRPDEERRIWVRQVPDIVARTFRERDEFISKVPPNLDVDKNGAQFEFDIADGLYRYGRFDEATPRFEKIWHEHCGVDDSGFEAWYRLGVMSNLMGNSKRSLELVDAAKKKSCAINEDQRLKEKNFSEPTELEALFQQADAAYNEAEKETDPKIKAQKYREAAAKYELALKRAPNRPEAPRATMNSAYCYKQVQEYKRAAEVYQFFLDRYGKEADLIAYRDGDAKKGIKKDPEQFKTRLDYTKQALGELGRTYLQAFDYPSAAKHFDEVSSRQLLDESERREAASNAVVLQANLGNRDKMQADLTRFEQLHPGVAEKADIEFVVAEFEFKQWKQSPNDAAQKTRAIQALTKYYGQYKGNGSAAKYVVDAAYDIASIYKSSGDGQFRDWYKKTSDAFLTYKTANKDAVGTREADYGAEAAYFFLDEQIAKDWDTPPGAGAKPKVVYEGTADKVIAKLGTDDKVREKYVQDLEDINKTYVSPKWFPVVLGREGTVYDTQRTALAKGKVQALDPATEKKITDIENKAQKVLNDPNSKPEDIDAATKLLDKASQLRDNVGKAWKDKRQQYYDVLDPAMIDRYARAYLRGKQFDVKDPMVTKSVQRLAFYTDQIGDEKMGQYVAGVEKDAAAGTLPPFKYKPGMFKQARPGSITSTPPNVDGPSGPGVGAGATTKPEG